jgi:hypothetical protein
VVNFFGWVIIGLVVWVWMRIEKQKEQEKEAKAGEERGKIDKMDERECFAYAKWKTNPDATKEGRSYAYHRGCELRYRRESGKNKHLE